MSAGAHDDKTEWAQEIARISARIDALKDWSDQESRLLQANIDAQIVDLRRDLRKLKAEVAAAGPDAYAMQIAAQIEELNAKGDLAYQRLKEHLSSAHEPTNG
jgi:hypothetical protein